eukprot:1617771-Amphidinium_carterae.1
MTVSGGAYAPLDGVDFTKRGQLTDQTWRTNVVDHAVDKSVMLAACNKLNQPRTLKYEAWCDTANNVLEEVLGDVGIAELVVLAVEVEYDVLVFDNMLVNVDVLDLAVLGDDAPVLGDDVSELLDADVVEDVDVHKEVLGKCGIVELVLLAVCKC